MRAVVLASQLLLAAAWPMFAQRVDAARYALSHPSSSNVRVDSIPKAADSSSVGLARFLLAVVGSGAGAVSGGYLGATKPSHCDDFCIPGSVLLGVVAGGVIGAALGAAAPSVPTCKWASRFGRGLAGGAAGLAIGILAAIPGAALSSPYAVLVPLIVGPAAGAAMALGGCRPR